MRKTVLIILSLVSISLAQIESDSLTHFFGFTYLNKTTNQGTYFLNFYSSSISTNLENSVNKNSIIPSFSFYYGNKINNSLFNVGSISINYDSYQIDYENEGNDEPLASILSIAPLYGVKKFFSPKYNAYPYYFIGISKVFTKVNLENFYSSEKEEEEMEKTLQKMASPARIFLEWGVEILFAKQFSVGLATSVYCDYIKSKTFSSSYVFDEDEISTYKVQKINIGKEAKLNLQIYF